DAALSRLVLHHVIDPPAFLARQLELLRPGGVLLADDHVTDPDPEHAQYHQRVERARDHTHTRCLTGGEIVDLMARAGLAGITLIEETFELDFDEWFDRGSPAAAKESVRHDLLSGPRIRGFSARQVPGGAVRIEGIRAIVRGVKS